METQNQPTAHNKDQTGIDTKSTLRVSEQSRCQDAAFLRSQVKKVGTFEPLFSLWFIMVELSNCKMYNLMQISHSRLSYLGKDLFHIMNPSSRTDSQSETSTQDETITYNQPQLSPAQQLPPPVHQSDADEEDENVKQLGDCSALYLSLQDCLIKTNRNWKSCQMGMLPLHLPPTLHFCHMRQREVIVLLLFSSRFTDFKICNIAEVQALKACNERRSKRK
ncbi:hypothetical protein Cgig2_012564 [Carnegiea gigantea]|uniref:Uncharacterized protein n=1 Tax=Carnegiea gigantea TaxID=171969 RepID=A0A9Q1K298_9CARY|nr:hypothetical protein Cgig2_012564 [Carnegiea gigantea]